MIFLHAGCILTYFYPRSPCGERLKGAAALFLPAAFLSTLSLRRATMSIMAGSPPGRVFLSTLSLRRATLWASVIDRIVVFLSTLSLRRATHIVAHFHQVLQFLSTLSLRRATIEQPCLISGIIHFYPRSPCGERRAI